VTHPQLENLTRDQLVKAAHEYMLVGMLVNRAMLPQTVVVTGSLDSLNDVAIDLWMGASPVYTHRMRELMGIDGDDIEAIMKALQLDCGFVHQYMDVAYVVHDERHGEFWLNHCGALLDAEPHGEERVFGMCHTIEDPTFDATALATNPRARIRPIHRPPRTPADRHPHCHWTIEIDPANDPVGQIPLTAEVGALPMASVPNAVTGDVDDGMADYRGPLRPALRLPDLASGTLAAVAREFAAQAHLLACSGELALRSRFGEDQAREMLAETWIGSAWTVTGRLAKALTLGDDPDGVATLLRLHPLLPLGFDREVTVDGDQVRLSLRPVVEGLLDAGHPGIAGLLARGDTRGIEAIVHGLAPAADVSVTSSADGVDVVVDGRESGTPVALPDSAALTQIGIAASWEFETA
jgi:hypothetical protein